MRILEQIQMRVQMLFRRNREARRLSAELEFHIEQQTAENIAAGMPPDEAHYAALCAFGNPTLLREQARETWSWNFMESLLRDFRYGIRTLGRTPGFSFLVILVMALGIGSTVALFTVVHSVLLKPLPLPGVDRLVRVYEAETTPKSDDHPVAGGTFKSWQQGNKTFQQLAFGFSENEYSLASSNGQLPERIEAQTYSWNALSMLGAQAAYGRLFMADDDRWGAPETTVLTWGFWKRRFGGDPGVVGRTILLDDKPFTVIGILPSWFTYPNPRTQLWTPVSPQMPLQVMESHTAHNFVVIGRLKPGVTLAAAQADLSNISAQVRKQFPEGPVDNAANLRPLLDAETRDIETPLYVLFAATGCLLLIACLNIANLLVARSASRRKELAIRTALGGSRGRLIRERVTEAVILSLAGGALGIGFAQIALQWLVRLRPDLPRVESIHLDGIAILFAAGVAFLCGIGAGLAPALGNREQQVFHALQEASRSTSAGHSSVKLRRTLLSVEVALTVVLLVSAGLLLRSYQRLRAVNIGIPTRNILTMSINLPDAKYGAQWKQDPQKIAFYEQLLERVRALPGVRSAALSTMLPGAGEGEDDDITIHEDPPLAPGKSLDANVRWVDPGYFHAMQIPLLKGRYFSEDERMDRNKYAIVNEAFVHEVMNGRHPIGKHVDDPNNGQLGDKSIASNEIVGVVGDVRAEPDTPPQPTVYYPLYGGSRNDLMLAVRTDSDPLSFALTVQKIVAQLDPTLPVADVLTLDEVIGKSTVTASFDATLLAAFAILSLVLAAVGLYGVLSYISAQRQGEIGIRIALGAQREQVLRLMLLDGLKPAIIGLIVGLAASAAATQLIRSLLFGTQPLDVAVFLLVTLVLLSVAAVACLIPAWRASQLDPMQALRTE
ncbi:MAG: ABC transporter permease [Acidobacteriaceae bacterium]